MGIFSCEKAFFLSCLFLKNFSLCFSLVKSAEEFIIQNEKSGVIEPSLIDRNSSHLKWNIIVSSSGRDEV